jgi:hypothetical protein
MVVVALATVAAVGLRSGSTHSAARPTQVRSFCGRPPLSFEENRGQTDSRVKFLARGRGYTLFLAGTDAVVALSARSHEGLAQPYRTHGIVPVGMASMPEKTATVRINLIDANPDCVASGVDRMAGKTNYFIGKDPAKWQQNVPTFAGVKFHEVYPGIDLIYRGAEGRVEYDFAISPNADPGRVRMRVEGADNVALAGNGDLIIKTAVGDVVEKVPRIYQETAGVRNAITGGYRLVGDDEVGFALGAYDHSRPLIIDPLLTYSTFLGGYVAIESPKIAVGADGSVWITGATQSTDFPLTGNAVQSTNHGFDDVFISKLSPDGSTLEYSSYLGGSNYDEVQRIVLDPAGDVFFNGYTYSADYPVTAGAYDTSAGSDTAINTFVTALDGNGQLIYSTMFAGVSGIAANSEGQLVVYGPGNVDPTQPCPLEGECSYVATLNASGSQLVSSGVFSFPPSTSSGGNALGLDAQGNAYIASGSNAIFVAKVAPDDSGLLYERGFFNANIVIDMAVEPSGNAHVVVGTAESDNPIYPLINLTPTGDATSVKLPLGPIDFPYADNSAFPYAVAVDSQSNIIIAGGSGPGLMTTPGGFQPNFGGEVEDGFLMKLDPSGQTPLYTTYLGGSSEDDATSVAVDASDNVYVAGTTSSSDFPITSGAYQTEFKGLPTDPGRDAFVVRLGLLPDAGPTASPTSSPSPTSTSTPTAIATPNPTPTATAGPVIYSPDALRFPAKKVGNRTGVRFVIVENPRRAKTTATLGEQYLLSQLGQPIRCPLCATGFVIDTTGTTCVAGLSLAPGERCRVAVFFAPIAKGSASDALVVSGNMSNAGEPISLSGMGR